MDTYVPSGVDQSWNPRPKRTWVKWVVVGVVGAVVVVAGVWWLLTRPPAKMSPMQQATSAAELAVSTCGKGTDAAACSTLAVSQQATTAKAAAVCDVLSGSAKDQCIVRTALASGDASMCAAVADAAERALCSRQFNRLTAENCQQLGGDATSCETERVYEAALKSGDPASCKSSDAEAQQGCMDMLAETDQDQDGLSFLQEHQYHTSDTNPDSDGDGFQDGYEVAHGFNPAGPGKLPANP